MNKQYLKNKIIVTKDLIEDFLIKSWLEIENLQTQIANIETDSNEAIKLKQLLNNLLTNYYIFAGNLETLKEAKLSVTLPEPNSQDSNNLDNQAQDLLDDNITNDFSTGISIEDNNLTNNSDFEPFEYFVDFDEPTGEPISDADLYTN